jgi:hypothetical protein
VDFNLVSDSKDEISLGLNLKVLDTQLLSQNTVGAVSIHPINNPENA